LEKFPQNRSASIGPEKQAMHHAQRIVELGEATLAMRAARDAAELGRITADSLERLIACDMAFVCVGVDPVAAKIEAYGTSADQVIAVSRGLSTSISEQNPLYLNRLRLLLSNPSTLGAFDADSKLDRTDFFDRFCRPLRARHILQYSNPADLPTSFQLFRGRGVDFDPSDIAVLQVLAAHYHQLLTHMRGKQGRALSFDGKQIVVRRQVWMVCDTKGRILRHSVGAAELLAELIAVHIPGHKDASRLPWEMRDALRCRLAGMPRRVLRYALPGRVVTAHLAPIGSVPGECACTLIEEPVAEIPQDRFRALGLTRRESEVLHWLCEGKTNGEIGVILGISALTAKKHVENLMDKLSVETRSAAVARALGDAGRPTN
jgi:DNA-binding CsgD family transcriptional regulator